MHTKLLNAKLQEKWPRSAFLQCVERQRWAMAQEQGPANRRNWGPYSPTTSVQGRRFEPGLYHGSPFSTIDDVVSFFTSFKGHLSMMEWKKRLASPMAKYGQKPPPDYAACVNQLFSFSRFAFCWRLSFPTLFVAHYAP